MAYLHQPWFSREIVNRFTMATGAVHSHTLTVMKRFSKQPQKIPAALSGRIAGSGVVFEARVRGR